MYESCVCSQVEEGIYGRIVAVDVESGTFELSDDILTATNALFKQLLFEQLSDAQSRIVCIGHRIVHHFGVQSLSSLQSGQTSPCQPKG
ncbi:hypothetical protein [Oculatella sp. FACHB-28]|uniref:hypothetical protein n=1 Tax=Oculatella sp. FACHB-28 TaxID=2692845 RepID=UPI00321FA61E